VSVKEGKMTEKIMIACNQRDSEFVDILTVREGRKFLWSVIHIDFFYEADGNIYRKLQAEDGLTEIEIRLKDENND